MDRKYTVPVLAKYRVTNDARQHKARAPFYGIDFAACDDTDTDRRKLLSMADGIIEFVFTAYRPELADDINADGGFHTLGRFIVARYYAGAVQVWARFCHNERADVTAGQTVGAGDVLGEYGNTGASDGPHVHVDFWIDAKDEDEATGLGFVRAFPAFDRNPWPGGPMLTNVDPTAFLKKCGLDVINGRG